MSGRSLFPLFLLLNFACQSIGNQEILVPKLNADFYTDALAELDKKLGKNANDDKLIRQKLYYCERLDWPVTCLPALNYERDRGGMTTQLADNYVRYYIKHSQFELLGDFIDKWDAQFSLYERNQRSYIHGLVGSGQSRKAQRHLRAFLNHSNDTASLSFASKQYLALGDTILGIYCLSRLRSQAAAHPLMYSYANILFKRNEHKRAYEVLEDYDFQHTLSLEQALITASNYAKHGYFGSAIAKLQPHQRQDTVSFFISDLYLASSEFDSAIMYLDAVIKDNPADLRAIWKKGRAYEDRGWYAYAMRLFEDILAYDTGYLPAQERIDLIQRKIAYLQRQKQEAATPPILELKPINLDN